MLSDIISVCSVAYHFYTSVILSPNQTCKVVIENVPALCCEQFFCLFVKHFMTGQFSLVFENKNK